MQRTEKEKKLEAEVEKLSDMSEYKKDFN